MLTLDVRNDPAAAGNNLPPGLDELGAALRQRLPDLPAPLLLHWSEDPVLTLDRGRPWIYGPIERDPMARAERTVVPRAALRRLSSLAERGLPQLQRLAIAHELDPTGPVNALLPLLRYGARRCTDGVARAVAGPVPPLPGTARVLGAVDGLLRRTGRTTVVGADALFDPIVFAVLGPRPPVHGEVCTWVAIAAWRW